MARACHPPRRPHVVVMRQVALLERARAMWKLAKLWGLFRNELRLVWAMLRDARTPAAAKLTAVLAMLYVISPLDLIPDLVPVLGWLDDGLVAYVLLQLSLKFLPPELLAALKAKIGTRQAPAAFRATP